MSVDVVYRGLVLAKQVAVREGTDGRFIELPAPMPVGTVLTLVDGDARNEVLVERIQEGLGAGMFIRPADEPARVTAPPAASDEEAGEEEAGEDSSDSSPGAPQPQPQATEQPPQSRRRRKRR